MKNIIFLGIGLLCGIVLSKTEAVSWYRIYEMFKFQSFQMYRNYRWKCSGSIHGFYAACSKREL